MTSPWESLARQCRWLADLADRYTTPTPPPSRPPATQTIGATPTSIPVSWPSARSWRPVAGTPPGRPQGCAAAESPANGAAADKQPAGRSSAPTDPDDRLFDALNAQQVGSRVAQITGATVRKCATVSRISGSPPRAWHCSREYIPQTLHQWLDEQMDARDEATKPGLRHGGKEPRNWNLVHEQSRPPALRHPLREHPDRRSAPLFRGLRPRNFYPVRAVAAGGHLSSIGIKPMTAATRSPTCEEPSTESDCAAR